MQYQHAMRLGLLHQQLGLRPDARMYLQIMTDGTLSAFIWDLDTERTYLVVHGNQPVQSTKDVPQHVKTIMAASDDELKDRWLSTMGWDEVRETVFSELSFREIDILRLEGINR